MRIAFLTVLALSIPALAQVSPNEANARLAQRQAQERAAATQPAKITNAQLQALGKEIMRLRSEVRRLLIDNAALKDRIDKMVAASTQPTKPTAQEQWSQKVAKAIHDGKILKGMTEAEARQASATELNSLVMRRGSGGPAIDSGLAGAIGLTGQGALSPASGIRESRGEGEDDYVTISWSNSAGEITVVLNKGKVVSFDEIK